MEEEGRVAAGEWESLKVLIPSFSMCPIPTPRPTRGLWQASIFSSLLQAGTDLPDAKEVGLGLVWAP